MSRTTLDQSLAEVDTALVRPTRSQVVSLIESTMAGLRAKWAWQGPVGAPQEWALRDDDKDLDIWWDPESIGGGSSSDCITALLDHLRHQLVGEPIMDSRRPGRLQHTSLVVRCAEGPAVIDFTHGNLQVGPITTLAASQVQTRDVGGHPYLAGTAAAADLVVRPLLRNKVPPSPRLSEGQEQWLATSGPERQAARSLWRAELGQSNADVLEAILSGTAPTATHRRELRRRLVWRSLRPDSLAATWRERRVVVPALRKGPFGLRSRGLVVAFVGTDGSGKSTTAAALKTELESLGFRTSEAYFGMGHGNLPGVATARRLAGVAPSQEPSIEPTEMTKPGLRRVAAWYYAVEYIWRYLTRVFWSKRRGRIVLVDRYVYDLRDSPWPGSSASRFAEAVVPAPDFLVLADAPMELIHQRKPERALAEQSQLQQHYRALLLSTPARRGNVVVDTSGVASDPVGRLAAAVTSAAHLN